MIEKENVNGSRNVIATIQFIICMFNGTILIIGVFSDIFDNYVAQPFTSLILLIISGLWFGTPRLLNSRTRESLIIKLLGVMSFLPLLLSMLDIYTLPISNIQNGNAFPWVSRGLVFFFGGIVREMIKQNWKNITNTPKEHNPNTSHVSATTYYVDTPIALNYKPITHGKISKPSSLNNKEG